MIRIRNEQAQTLALVPLRQLVPEALAFLQREAAEIVAEATEQELRELAALMLDKAHRYGLYEAYHALQLVLHAVWCGPGFDEEPWAVEVLTAELSPAEKIARIEDRIFERASEDPSDALHPPVD